MFSAAGPQEGKLTGAQVKPVMLQSSLPSTVLAKVENIFVVAQKYLVVCTRCGPWRTRTGTVCWTRPSSASPCT